MARKKKTATLTGEQLQSHSVESGNIDEVTTEPRGENIVDDTTPELVDRPDPDPEAELAGEPEFHADARADEKGRELPPGPEPSGEDQWLEAFSNDMDKRFLSGPGTQPGWMNQPVDRYERVVTGQEAMEDIPRIQDALLASEEEDQHASVEAEVLEEFPDLEHEEKVEKVLETRKSDPKSFNGREPVYADPGTPLDDMHRGWLNEIKGWASSELFPIGPPGYHLAVGGEALTKISAKQAAESVKDVGSELGSLAKNTAIAVPLTIAQTMGAALDVADSVIRLIGEVEDWINVELGVSNPELWGLAPDTTREEIEALMADGLATQLADWARLPDRIPESRWSEALVAYRGLARFLVAMRLMGPMSRNVVNSMGIKSVWARRIAEGAIAGGAADMLMGGEANIMTWMFGENEKVRDSFIGWLIHDEDDTVHERNFRNLVEGSLILGPLLDIIMIAAKASQNLIRMQKLTDKERRLEVLRQRIAGESGKPLTKEEVKARRSEIEELERNKWGEVSANEVEDAISGAVERAQNRLDAIEKSFRESGGVFVDGKPLTKKNAPKKIFENGKTRKISFSEIVERNENIIRDPKTARYVFADVDSLSPAEMATRRKAREVMNQKRKPGSRKRLAQLNLASVFHHGGKSVDEFLKDVLGTLDDHVGLTAQTHRAVKQKARRGVDQLDLRDVLALGDDEVLNSVKSVQARQLLGDLTDVVHEMGKKAGEGTATVAEKYAFRQALVIHRAVLERILGVRANAGRSVDSWRIDVHSDIRRAQIMQEGLEATGGNFTLDKILYNIDKLDHVPGSGINDKMAGMMELSAGQKFEGIMRELATLAPLWSVKTHIKNHVGTGYSVFVMDTLSSFIGGRISHMKGDLPEDMMWRDQWKAKLIGFQLSWRDALTAAGERAVTGKSPVHGLTSSKLDIPQESIFGQLKTVSASRAGRIYVDPFRLMFANIGKIHSLSGRMLMSADEFYTFSAYRSNLYEQAYVRASREAAELHNATKKLDLQTFPLDKHVEKLSVPEMVLLKGEVDYKISQELDGIEFEAKHLREGRGPETIDEVLEGLSHEDSVLLSAALDHRITTHQDLWVRKGQTTTDPKLKLASDIDSLDREELLIAERYLRRRILGQDPVVPIQPGNRTLDEKFEALTPHEREAHLIAISDRISTYGLPKKKAPAPIGGTLPADVLDEIEDYTLDQLRQAREIVSERITDTLHQGSSIRPTPDAGSFEFIADNLTPNQLYMTSAALGNRINAIMERTDITSASSIANPLKFKDDVQAGAEMMNARMMWYVRNPPADMQAEAIKHAKRATFTDREHGDTLQKILRFQKKPGAYNLATYISTPASVFKNGVRHTPLVNRLLKDVREDLDAGGARAARAHAQTVAGAATMSLYWEPILYGDMFVVGSPDRGERQLQYEHGHRRHTVTLHPKYDGKMIVDGVVMDVGTVEQLLPTLVVMGRIAEIWKEKQFDEDDPDFASIMADVASVFISGVVSPSFLANGRDIMQVLSEERSSNNWVWLIHQRAMQHKPFVGALDNMAGEYDDTIRSTSANRWSGEAGVFNSLLYDRIPVWESRLPYKPTYMGGTRDISKIWFPGFSLKELGSEFAYTEVRRLGLNPEPPRMKQQFSFFGAPVTVDFKDYPTLYPGYVRFLHFGMKLFDGQTKSYAEEMNNIDSGPGRFEYEMKPDHKKKETIRAMLRVTRQAGRFYYFANHLKTIQSDDAKELRNRLLKEHAKWAVENDQPMLNE
jgi:hypothetical protein